MAREITVEFTRGVDQRCRVRYELRADGEGWWRIDEEHTGCTWRTVGREPVADVVVEDAEVAG